MPVEDNAADLQDDFKLLEGEPEEAPKEAPKPKLEVKAPVVEDDEVKEEEEEEPIEVDEKKEEPETKEQDNKELLPHERPTMDQIKKKFPDFFKTFPTLQAAFNRERQFSEIFHTPAEAADVARTAEDYQTLREDIVNGDGSKLIPALKESESLAKFSKSFLPNLYKADKDVHWQVILPVLEDMVKLSYREGVRTKNDDLKFSAMHIAGYLLGDTDIAEGKKTLIDREEPKKPDQERQQWENERYNTFNIDVHESVYDSLSGAIKKGYKEEDGLTDFMKNSITKEVLEEVTKLVGQDKIFTKYKDRLWKEAKSNGYKTSDKSRIIDAVLARAKELVPSIRRRLIGEALGSSPLEADKRREKLETTNSRKEPGSQGRDGVTKSKTPAAKQVNWGKTSDLDFLSDNVTLRK